MYHDIKFNSFVSLDIKNYYVTYSNLTFMWYGLTFFCISLGLKESRQGHLGGKTYTFMATTAIGGLAAPSQIDS